MPLGLSARVEQVDARQVRAGRRDKVFLFQQATRVRQWVAAGSSPGVRT